MSQIQEKTNNQFKIKQLCKERHITMAELATQMGITPITLSQTLSRNPTLSRLTEIANVLGVEVADLFERSTTGATSIFGCLWVNGKPIVVNSRAEIEAVLNYNPAM